MARLGMMRVHVHVSVLLSTSPMCVCICVCMCACVCVCYVWRLSHGGISQLGGGVYTIGASPVLIDTCIFQVRASHSCTMLYIGSWFFQARNRRSCAVSTWRAYTMQGQLTQSIMAEPTDPCRAMCVECLAGQRGIIRRRWTRGERTAQ